MRTHVVWLKCVLATRISTSTPRKGFRMVAKKEKEKEASKGYHPRRLKLFFFAKMVQEIVQQLRSKKTNPGHQRSHSVLQASLLVEFVYITKNFDKVFGYFAITTNLTICISM